MKAFKKFPLSCEISQKVGSMIFFQVHPTFSVGYIMLKKRSEKVNTYPPQSIHFRQCWPRGEECSLRSFGPKMMINHRLKQMCIDCYSLHFFKKVSFLQDSGEAVKLLRSCYCVNSGSQPRLQKDLVWLLSAQQAKIRIFETLQKNFASQFETYLGRKNHQNPFRI